MKQLNAIYWFHILNTAGWSLIGIFVPVYLLILGYSPREIFVYFMIQSIAIFLFCNLAGYWCSRIGMKKIMLLSFVFFFIFIGMFYGLDKFPIFFFPIAFVHAANIAFYCLPLHFFFINSADDKKIGNDTGKLLAFQQIASMAGPIVGGFIAVMGGFPLLIAGAGLICFVASFLLLFIDNNFPKIKFDFRVVGSFLIRYRRYSMAEMANGFQSTFEEVGWPVFIFLIFNNIFSVGAVGSALALGGVFFTFAIGRRCDAMKKKNLIVAGALVVAFIWIIRANISQEIAFYITALAFGFFSALIYVPLTAYAYSIAKKENIVEFIIFRELPILAGRLLLFSLLYLAADNIGKAFIAAALANFFFLFL